MWDSRVLKNTLLALLLALAVILPACGYTVRGGEEVAPVRIGSIENRTFEPYLEDVLAVALTDELMRSGVRVERGAARTIAGTIDEFTLRPLAEKSGVAVSYEVVIRGRFTLNDGKTERALRGGGSFMVTFSSEDSLDRLMAMKEQARDRALQDFASEIAASVLYE